jgi:hypothetical protein
MFNYLIKAGKTDVSVVIRIIDSTDGTPETGVAYNTSGIALEYRREGATSTAITEADLAGLDSAHADGGFKHIGNGYYRLDLPDAACAVNVTGVLVHGVVTGMVVIGCYIQLVTFDPFDTVRLGLTALPNAAADAAGGLPISDAGGLDLDAKLANTNEVTAARMGALTDWINGGRLDLILDDIIATLDLAHTDIDAILADTNELQSEFVDGGRLDLLIDAIKAKTDQLVFTTANKVDSRAFTVDDKTGYAIGTGGIAAAAFASGAIDAAALAADAAAEIADKILGRNLAGGSDGTRTVQDALRILRNKRVISGGTLTVMIEDDATPAWTAAIETTAGNPVSSVDPA